MKTITKYKANDGAEFNTADECSAYEAESSKIDQILAPLGILPKDEGCRFANGHGYFQHEGGTVLEVQRRLAKIVQAQFGDDPDYKRHIDYAIEATVPVGLSFIGRLIDDACRRPMREAWQRICCIDHNFREWGQPYFALNPGIGEHVRLSLAATAGQPK